MTTKLLCRIWQPGTEEIEYLDLKTRLTKWTLCEIFNPLGPSVARNSEYRSRAAEEPGSTGSEVPLVTMADLKGSL